MPREPLTAASTIVVPPAMRPREGEIYRPARPRYKADDSAQLDVTTLAVYAAGVAPTPLPNLGSSTGVIVLGGEYGGLLFSLAATPPRPMAGVVGRPIWRLDGSQLFGWQTSKGWGNATLEFFEWYDDENPIEQLEQILRWTQGYAQPTVDVTASVSVPGNRKTTVVDRAKGDPPAAFPLQATNLGTTIRNRAYLSSGLASVGTLSVATDAAELAAGNTDDFAPGEWGSLPGTLYFDNDEAVTFEVIEALP
jgi:hypothetical protein